MLDDFFSAVEGGKISTVKEYLQENPGLVHAARGLEQAIHIASAQNYPEIVELLIHLGADPNARGEDGKTPLHFAAGYSPGAAKVLIADGADVNAIDDFGCTPLVPAILEQTQEGDEIIKLLRNAGASYDLTPAALLGDLERIKEILKDDPKAISKVSLPEENLLPGILAVGHASLSDREEILKLLFAHGLNVDKDKLLKYAECCDISKLLNFARILRENAEKAT